MAFSDSGRSSESDQADDGLFCATSFAANRSFRRVLCCEPTCLRNGGLPRQATWRGEDLHARKELNAKQTFFTSG